MHQGDLGVLAAELRFDLDERLARRLQVGRELGDRGIHPVDAVEVPLSERKRVRRVMTLIAELEQRRGHEGDDTHCCGDAGGPCDPAEGAVGGCRHLVRAPEIIATLCHVSVLPASGVTLRFRQPLEVSAVRLTVGVEPRESVTAVPLASVVVATPISRVNMAFQNPTSADHCTASASPTAGTPALPFGHSAMKPDVPVFTAVAAPPSAAPVVSRQFAFVALGL